MPKTNVLAFTIMAAVVFAFALAAAACGGDDDDAEAETESSKDDASDADQSDSDKSGAEQSDDDASEKGEKYPEEVRENYLGSCSQASGGLDDYCSCTLERFESSYSLEEYAALEQEFLQTGLTGVPEFQEVIDSCLDELE